MRKWIGFAAIVTVVALGFALLGQQGAEAQIKKGKTRAAQTKYLMKGINGAHCGALGKALKSGPETDEDWEAIKLHASLLNEMGYLLMADGRCPDGTWKGACDTLKECSAVILAAAEEKDAEAATSAFKQLTSACGTCHKAHKN
jgi:hypothetical protein